VCVFVSVCVCVPELMNDDLHQTLTQYCACMSSHVTGNAGGPEVRLDQLLGPAVAVCGFSGHPAFQRCLHIPGGLVHNPVHQFVLACTLMRLSWIDFFPSLQRLHTHPSAPVRARPSCSRASLHIHLRPYVHACWMVLGLVQVGPRPSLRLCLMSSHASLSYACAHPWLHAGALLHAEWAKGLAVPHPGGHPCGLPQHLLELWLHPHGHQDAALHGRPPRRGRAQGVGGKARGGRQGCAGASARGRL